MKPPLPPQQAKPPRETCGNHKGSELFTFQKLLYKGYKKDRRNVYHGTSHLPGLDTHPRGGALRELSRGEFRVLIRAGQGHRTEAGKGRVKGSLQGGATGNWAHSDESAPQHRNRGLRDARGRIQRHSIPHRPGSRVAERG